MHLGLKPALCPWFLYVLDMKYSCIWHTFKETCNTVLLAIFLPSKLILKPALLIIWIDSMLHAAQSRDLILARARFSATIHPDTPWSPPSLLYKGYQSFSRIKRPRHGINHPPSLSALVKKKVELYLHSFSVPSQHVIMSNLPFTFLSSELTANLHQT